MTPAGSGLDPLEVASGLVFGLDLPAPLPDPGGTSPRQAFEAAIVRALERPPCLVSFSGGRDSSAVLAVATSIARRESLPEPIPATNRFPDAPGSDESAWQEQVVSHLGLRDWLRPEHGGELDCVGPVARAVLRRHGLLWPFNAHFHVPVFEAAAGGSVLTGVGGDETLGAPSGARALAVLGGRVRPRARDALRVGFALSPRALRRVVARRRFVPRLPWLLPDVQRHLARTWADAAAGEPLRWAARVEHVGRLRYLRIGGASLALLARDAGTTLVHPFLDRSFAAALAHLPRRRRFVDRRGAMRELFGDVLPDAIVARRSKSHFDEAFWHDDSRKLAASWDGSGVDTSIVDEAALRDVWASPRPDARTYTLLQSVWLAGERGAAAQPDTVAIR
jgi:asparagine synthase (glutamine-hydrolysing)